MSDAEMTTINPEDARKFLKGQSTNRPIRKQEVQKIKEAILSGDWQLNGETVKFDAEGKLVDGQHRLRAIVAANQPVETYVIYNVSDDALMTIDSGIKRRVADQLIIDGVTTERFNAQHLSSSVGVLLKWERQQWGWNPSAVEVKNFLENNPAIFDAIDYMKSYRQKLTWIRSTYRVPIAARFKFHNINPKASDEFFENLFIGNDISHPAMVLGRQISRNSRQYSVTVKTEVALFVKAWKAQLDGGKPKRFLYKRMEDFPLL